MTKRLGPGGLSLLVDHPNQIHSVYRLKDESGIAPQIYLKVDMGYGRAGVLPQSQVASQLISDILSAEEVGAAVFCGLYSHGGNSYYGNDIASTVDVLRQEFEALLVTAEEVKSSSPSKKLILSVGATPTTTSVRNLLLQESAMTTDEKTATHALRATIAAIKTIDCEVELHAGVYPVLDIQQLATRALPTAGPHQMLSWSDLGLTILAEVVSIYPGRGKDGRPEVLIAAGSLALGREPCKAYSGWGIVSPWKIEKARMPDFGPDMHDEWQVGRISQEHGILTWHGTWKGNEEDVSPPTIGQKLRVWPNHACIAGAGFDWYLVIDSETNANESKIIDVWPRWRGW
jgi:D-serine deaminase-like pyridoxal phosphate-dependent protein